MQCINIKHINLGQNNRRTAWSMQSFVEVGKSEFLENSQLKEKNLAKENDSVLMNYWPGKALKGTELVTSYEWRAT